MDYRGDTRSTGNVVEIIPQTQEEIGADNNWMPSLSDQAIWATEDDYNVWNADGGADTPSNSKYTRSGSEPPNKKLRGGDSQLSGFGRDRDLVASGNRSRAIGKMFFKTKLCCKFRNGTCPYITNCNFAHGIEELRQPPPNWQEIVAAQDDDRGVLSEPREEHQIPCLISTGLSTENHRSYKGRHCKKFYTEEGCPYGDNCTFLHDEQSKARESVAISLGPTFGGGNANAANGSAQKPSNWKTRICNKWETTRYCPFGSKCHFAHGLGAGAVPELHPVDPTMAAKEIRVTTQLSPTGTERIGSTISEPSLNTGDWLERLLMCLIGLNAFLLNCVPLCFSNLLRFFNWDFLFQLETLIAKDAKDEDIQEQWIFPCHWINYLWHQSTKMPHQMF